MNARQRATLLLLAVVGCGGGAVPVDAGAEAATCERADPSCPSVVPSYASTVHAILEGACVTCHYPTSPYAESSLATYDSVHLVYGSVLGQVSACLMPPPGQPPLTTEQRTALLSWLACKAPDN